MSNNHTQQSWWGGWSALYATLAITIGLLLLEESGHWPQMLHQIADATIILLGFGLMALWLKASNETLVKQEGARDWRIAPDPDDQPAAPSA